MKKFSRKALALALTLVLGTTMLATGCKNGGGEGNSANSDSGLDTEIAGDISIMMWGGDGEYYENIGQMDLKPEDITTSNVAQVYAVAKKFNETYPNVSINLWSKPNDPDQVGTPTWDQEMENFKADYGKYPDIWASTNVTNDIKKGLVADLSVFAEDELYKAYNPSLMEQLNYYGFQAGLPSYTIPHGVWINKALATNNNIEVPDPDWDIDDYTDFVESADAETFWGDKGAGTVIIDIGTNVINKQISTEGTVNLNSDEVKELLDYVPKWAEVSINVAEGAGTLAKDIAVEGRGYSWFYFCNNRALTNITDPWFLTAAADENGDPMYYVNSSDWDFYPFPSTDYCENTVKVIMDPICLHNYAADDGNKEWSEEEKEKLEITYEFASFWTATTEAKQAVFDQQWSASGKIKSAAGDTFPVVTGELYDEQMEIWNSLPAHQVYAEKEGWQAVLKIWEEGPTWDYADKCWTSTITENGETKRTLYEWENSWDEAISGAWQTDPDWVDNVKSRLADWNTTCNERIATAQEQLKQALKDNYGFTDEQLQ